MYFINIGITERVCACGKVRTGAGFSGNQKRQSQNCWLVQLYLPDSCARLR